MRWRNILTEPEWQSLNYGDILPDSRRSCFEGSIWPLGQHQHCRNGFTLRKEKSDFLTMRPDPYFDLVYFDAFAPDKQPELWSSNLFLTIAGLMRPDGILVSYTAKGSVRRELAACGFRVDKVPGPPGKREMIRATKR
ncbi:MAG: MnmC family methyltransferase [Bacteroidales bacterium]